MTCPSIVLTRWREDPEGRPWQGLPGVGFDYLGKTLLQLRAQGCVNPVVVVDMTGYDQADVVDEQRDELWRVAGVADPIVFRRAPGTLGGNKEAYFYALSVAADMADEVIVMEDDLMFCGNAHQRMRAFLLPHDLDWVSFFAPHVFGDSDGRTWPGLWRTPAPSVCLQAIKFRRPALRRLVDWARTDPAFGMFQAADQALDRARVAMRMRWGAHCPELVQHVGAISHQGDAIDGKNRTSRTWPGMTHDALQWFARQDLFE